MSSRNPFRNPHRLTALLTVLIVVVVGAGLVVRPIRAQAPARPTISAKVGEQVIKGVAGSFCWPDASGSPVCEIVDEPDPKTEITIKGGGLITFLVDPPVDKIDILRVAVVDNLNAAGDPVTIDILGSQGVYIVGAELKPGKQRIHLELFTNSEQYFVFYAFLVNVTEAISSAPTTVSPAGTMAATTAATMAATMAGTAPAMMATLSPTMAATEPAMMATMAATPEAPLAGTMVATTVATMAATAPAMMATQAPTMAATTAATAAPTVAATPPPPTAPSPDTVFPAMVLALDATEYQPIAIEGCTIKADNTRTCLSGAVNANTPNAEGKPGADIIYLFKGPQPSASKLTTRGTDGIRVIAQEDGAASNVILTSLPKQAGSYILTVEVTYSGAQVTYFFRVSVK